MRKVFDYDGYIIGVESLNESHLDWLEEFLSPSFLLSGSEFHVSISHLIDAQRYHHQLALGSDGRELVAFVQDNGVLKLPVWSSRGPGVVLHDAKYEAFYHINENRIIVLCGKDDVKIRYSLMRIIRELAMGYAQSPGGFLLHAAAFMMGESSVIVSGPKEAGKTSLLSYVLSATDVSYLTNDRLHVNIQQDSIKVRGIPTILSVRQGTFDLFPGLLAEVERRCYRLHATLAECAEKGTRPIRPWPDGRRGFTPAQWCELFGSSMKAHGDNAIILFPSLSGQPGGITLRELSPVEASSRLETCRFGGSRHRQLSEVFTVLPDDTSQLQDTDPINLLVRRCVGYDCSIGQNAYADNNSAELLEKQIAAIFEKAQFDNVRLTEGAQPAALN